MPQKIVFIAMITSTSLLASTALAQTANFDDAATGAAPSGWTATKTGTGEAKWTIERDNMKVASGEWHTLRVDFIGNHFRVTFDGKKALEWDDQTYTDAGMIGVWTKADSVTLFDDFRYGSK